MASYTYERARMQSPRDGSAHAAAYLFGSLPTVVRLDAPPQTLELRFGSFRGPAELGFPAEEKAVCGFNPSVVRAPRGVCARCAYLAAVRADVMHQCNASSPLYSAAATRPTQTGAWFKNTAIAALDARRRVVGWTWLLSRPERQVATWASPRRTHVPPGAADGFAPPWANQVYDTRLLYVADELLATYNCAFCLFSLSHLLVTATDDASGRPTHMRAWARLRLSFREAWVQGRNQALFVGPRQQLLVQPWLGLVGSAGKLHFSPRGRRRRLGCYQLSESQQQKVAAAADPAAAAAAIKARDRQICGPLPEGAAAPLRTISKVPQLRLLLNETVGETDDLRGRSAPLRGLRVPNARLSTTANLVRVRLGGCEVYLGVGHLHRREGLVGRLDALLRLVQRAKARGEGAEVRRLRARIRQLHLCDPRRHERNATPPAPSDNATARDFCRNASDHPFAFGYEYKHFWYALSVKSPFPLLAASAEFCLGSAQDPSLCESIQFVSSLTVDSPSSASVLLGYGVNDCEAKVGTIGVHSVWEMLRPIHSQGTAHASASTCKWRVTGK
ncbi:hypothetical protein AB1Y20_017201 [Prymnesium parvum]|uniref:Uncharacterized protein n=1 Tax=Prymnesium parvum TaxID=97485 RepID=A0AB34I874_PRYPA